MRFCFVWFDLSCCMVVLCCWLFGWKVVWDIVVKYGVIIIVVNGFWNGMKGVLDYGKCLVGLGVFERYGFCCMF